MCPRGCWLASLAWRESTRDDAGVDLDGIQACCLDRHRQQRGLCHAGGDVGLQEPWALIRINDQIDPAEVLMTQRAVRREARGRARAGAGRGYHERR